MNVRALLSGRWPLRAMAAAAILVPALLTRGLTRGMPGRLVFGVGLLAVLLALLPRGEAIHRTLRRHPLPRLLLLCAAAVLVTWPLLGANLQARFGLIDDHDILDWTGSDGELELGEAWQLIARNEEVGRLDAPITRYRPAYYTLHTLETWAFGANPQAWYAFRLLLFASLLCFLGWMLLPWVGPIFVLPGVFLLLSVRGWADVWTRLGPSETYAMWALGLLALGVYGVVMRVRRRKPGPSIAGWLAILFGFAVSAGSKENFLFTLPLVWGLLVWLRRRGQAGAVAWIGTGLVTLQGLFLGAVILHRLSQAQADVYEQPVGLAGRVALLPRALLAMGGEAAWLWAWAFVAASLGLHLWIRRRALGTPRRGGLRASALRFLLVVAGLALIFVSQFVFYNGSIRPGWRYELPAMLVPPVIMLASSAFAVRSARGERVRGKQLGALRAVFLAALVALLTVGGLGHVRSAARANAESTRAFNVQIEAVAAALRGDPDRPLLLEVHDVWDIEPVYSAVRRLIHLGVRSRIHLELAPGYRADESEPLQRQVTDAFTEISREGRSAWGIEALGAMRGNEPPFGVGFSGPAPTGSVDLGTLTWLKGH